MGTCNALWAHVLVRISTVFQGPLIVSWHIPDIGQIPAIRAVQGECLIAQTAMFIGPKWAPTRVLSAPDGPDDSPINLAIREYVLCRSGSMVAQGPQGNHGC